MRFALLRCSNSLIILFCEVIVLLLQLVVLLTGALAALFVRHALDDLALQLLLAVSGFGLLDRLASLRLARKTGLLVDCERLYLLRVDGSRVVAHDVLEPALDAVV